MSRRSSGDLRRRDIAPGVVLVGRNGRHRRVISIEPVDEGEALVIYELVRSIRPSGKRHGQGYVGACQISQMLKWACKVKKESP